VLEVRENDLFSEISVHRGLTPPVGEETSLLKDSYNRVQGKNCLHNQEEGHDSELEIILDTRMINKIDLSRAALEDINKRLQDKKNVLIDLEQQMDDVSKSLVSSTERQDLSLKSERDVTHSSSRVERTRGFESPNRSRAGGSRIWSPKFIQTMAMSQGSEINLPSQGALGSPRDRHGGAPDAAGSTVLGRESGEGTVGAVSASAPTEKMATAEFDPLKVVSCDYAGTPPTNLPGKTLIQATGEKRKASTSPGSEVDAVEGVITRRPLKARVIESTESPEARSVIEKDDSDGAESVVSVSDVETEMAVVEELDTSSPDNRVTRARTRRSGETADFSQLTAARQKRINKSGKAGDKDYKETKQTEASKKPRRPSSEFREEYIESVVTRIQKAGEESKSDVLPARAERRGLSDSSRSHEEEGISPVPRDPSEQSSDSTIESRYCSSNKKAKKKNTNKRSAIDPTFKNPVQKSRRKTKIPIIVSKDEAEKELKYTRKA